MMHRIVTNRLSRALMIASWLGGWAPAWHCHDGWNIALASHAAVADHDCGNHERHLPPERVRHCAICTASAHRCVAPAFSEGAISALGAVGNFFPDESIPVHSPFVFSPGQRGPPAS